MSEEVKHPRALAIAKKGETCLWEMGDYLIEAVGRPPKPGANDGSGIKIKEIADELLAHGYQSYTSGYLQDLRAVAHAFPAGARAPAASVKAHIVAGTPEMLEAAVSEAKRQKLKTVQVSLVQQIVRAADTDQRAKRKGVAIQAQNAADAAKKKAEEARLEKQRAKDTKEREAAEKKEAKARADQERNQARANKLKGAPKRDPSKRLPPKSGDTALSIIKQKFEADSAKIVVMLAKMDKAIDPCIDDLARAFVVGSVAELLEIAEAARQLAKKLNRNQANKRAHLQAVDAA